MRNLVRRIGLVGTGIAIIIAACTATPRKSQALIIYQWCATYSGGTGAINCGFATYEQCRATVAGIGNLR